MSNELLDYFQARDMRRRRRWHTLAVIVVTAVAVAIPTAILTDRYDDIDVTTGTEVTR